MLAITAALLLAQSAAATAQPSIANASVNPRVLEPFERDWVLMDWGLRFYDRDKDARLSLEEASVAAAAFKEMADGDRDGRVSTYEFDRAREFLFARY
jgi:hypothetical protein